MTDNDLKGLEDRLFSRLEKLISSLVSSRPPPVHGPLPSLPVVLTMERAAKELSVGRTTLDTMIRKGAISTCIVNQRRMIPASEVQRIARERVAPKGQRKRKRGTLETYDAKAEAEKARKLRY